MFVLGSWVWMGLVDEDLRIGQSEEISAMVMFGSIFSKEAN